MSKFPSLRNIANATKKTLLRFPLETIAAIVGTVFAIFLFDADYNNPSKELYLKAIMSSSLCFVLFLSVSLYFFASQKNNFIRFCTSLFLGGLVISFVFNFEKEPTDLEIQQFLVLNISLHLLVSFAAFLSNKYDQDDFWEFNKQLFLRILTAVLYSFVLYGGLALALLAIKELFKVSFDSKIFAYLFFIIAGIFNSLFFLNGVPALKNNEKSLQLNYPNGLKNFTQYILLPLISLYLVILIGYEAKILITLSLPIGWVSYLVLVFAIFGILSFLLVYPIVLNDGNLWMRTFNQWFYYLLIPLLGLLFWAIAYRISLYGVTHERYYVVLLSIWLAIVVAYFLIKKDPKIKFIPVSLCLAGLLSLVGPQSANAIAKNSQLARYTTYIKKTTNEKLNFEQEKDLSSIVDFLEQNYGAKALLIPETKDKLNYLFENNKKPTPAEIMKALGVEHRYRYATENDLSTNFYYEFYENSDTNVENINGYDLAFTVSSYTNFDCINCVTFNKIPYSITSIKKNYGLDLQINDEVIPLKIVEFVNNQPLFDKNDSNTQKITQVVEHSKYQILVRYLSINGTKSITEKEINNYSLKILIKIKN